MASRRSLLTTLVAAPAALRARAEFPSPVSVELPPIAETGNSVPIRVSVDAPMTAEDHVRRIEIRVPGNPEPIAATYFFTPDSGVAAVRTNIRLARTQRVTAVAEFSDGRQATGFADIVVTLGACVDEIYP
ncbi:MAG: hypothetical protein OXM56_13120 [Gammaproteobacteria bacterium]|nr:hypothetical protein [Gammaproteobacteria bacterium]